MTKLWGGRFEGETDREVERFTESLSLDARLWAADLTASTAHARMLGATGVIPAAEAALLIEGLAGLATLEGPPSADGEDVHSEIERRLTERLGPVAGKLHTGRSRNDQVTTATRLYLRGHIDELTAEIALLQRWLVDTAGRHAETVLPGTTHLQHAQPVSLAHHLLAYFWMLQRDRDRLADCRRRVNRLPLGSAALAGTSFPLDRNAVARELGFDGLCENSLDAVSDRDFVVEFLAAGALVMTHLSRLAEEIVLWSTPEFAFVELADAVTTGSSIMPQKKNPDVAELIRGRSGRLTGALMGALTMLKGLPLSYNRDLQEDKVHLFQGVDTVQACVRLSRRMLEGAKFRTDRMARAVEGDFSNATDLADYLVRKGLPFRQAHEVVGRIVRTCLENGTALEGLPLTALRAFSPLIDEDLLPLLVPAAVMAARTSAGGTAPSAVREQLASAESRMAPC